MNLDPNKWSPLSAEEVAEVLAGLPVPWWIAGGVALDLFLGHSTRPHEDIVVQILRRDQLVVRTQLSDWQVFRTKPPTPRPSSPG